MVKHEGAGDPSKDVQAELEYGAQIRTIRDNAEGIDVLASRVIRELGTNSENLGDYLDQGRARAVVELYTEMLSCIDRQLKLLEKENTWPSL